MNAKENEAWRQDLYDRVERIWRSFVDQPNVVGLAIGGSLGRGQEHPGSDLELAVLTSDPKAEAEYLQVMEGVGVDVMLFKAREVEDQIRQVTLDPTACVVWPIQLWRFRVVHDPTGLFGRMRDAFDPALLLPATLLLQKTNSLKGYPEEREHIAALAETKPATALAKLRNSFNSLVCAAFWHHGRLPKSQNRTHQRLSDLCAVHGRQDLLTAFEQVYGMPVTLDWARNAMAACAGQRNKLTVRWGTGWRDFFIHSIDSELEVRDFLGIISVHRLYLPMIPGDELDDPVWRKENAELLTWLDLAEVDAQHIDRLLKITDTIHESLKGQLAPKLDDPLA